MSTLDFLLQPPWTSGKLSTQLPLGKVYHNILVSKRVRIPSVGLHRSFAFIGHFHMLASSLPIDPFPKPSYRSLVGLPSFIPLRACLLIPFGFASVEAVKW